jgi:hypothetical protein
MLLTTTFPIRVLESGETNAEESTTAVATVLRNTKADILGTFSKREFGLSTFNFPGRDIETLFLIARAFPGDDVVPPHDSTRGPGTWMWASIRNHSGNRSDQGGLGSRAVWTI